jgi:hypothetical protein
MKKLFLLFLLCFFQKSYAQDSTAFNRLLQQYTRAYSQNEKSAPGNFFELLSLTSGNVLQLANPLFMTVKKNWRKQNPAKPDTWLVEQITKKINIDFARYYFDKKEKDRVEKYLPALALIAKKTCPCYSSELKKKTYKNLEEAFGACDQQIVKDETFMKEFRTLLTGMNASDQQNLQTYSFPFLYNQCAPVRDTFNMLITHFVLEGYETARENIALTADEMAGSYYRENKKDSLQLLFPAYTRYEVQMVQAISIFDRYDHYVRNSKKTGNTREVTKTYLDMHGKVLGRTVYLLDEENILRTLTYVSEEKIPAGEKKIIMETKDVPPPQMPVKN